MTLYSIALFAHILGVLGLFMAVALEMTSMLGMRRARMVEQVRTWANLSSVSDKVLPLTALPILVAGVYMAFVAWGWQTAWIDVSLLVLILIGIVGTLVNSRRLRMIHRDAEQASAGPVPLALVRQIEDPVLWTSVQTLNVMALGVVFLMTVKPSWLGALVVLVLSIVLGVISAPLLKRVPKSAATAEASQLSTR